MLQAVQAALQRHQLLLLAEAAVEQHAVAVALPLAVAAAQLQTEPKALLLPVAAAQLQAARAQLQGQLPQQPLQL